jgi:hypothetical protein
MDDQSREEFPGDVREVFDMLFDFLAPIAWQELQEQGQLVPVGAAFDESQGLHLVAVVPPKEMRDGSEIMAMLITTMREDREDKRAVAVVENVSFVHAISGDEKTGLQFAFEHRSGTSRSFIVGYHWSGRLRRRLEFEQQPLGVDYSPRVLAPK